MENEYLDLPDDPEEGFAILHFRKLKEVELSYESEQNHVVYASQEKYIDTMIAFNDVNSLRLFDDLKPRVNSESGTQIFEEFRRFCEITSQKFLMESARRQKANGSNLVTFSGPEKTTIHHLIQRIREKLEGLDLDENKRDALFSKLNAFAKEVDLNRTRTEAIFSIFVDLAREARNASDEIKPILQTVDKILDTIEKAKRQVKDVLEPWAKQKQIEAPKKKLPNLSDEQSDDDGEIPF